MERAEHALPRRGSPVHDPPVLCASPRQDHGPLQGLSHRFELLICLLGFELRAGLRHCLEVHLAKFMASQIPQLKRFVGWYRKVQTTDLTMGGCAVTPALGDANWEQVRPICMLTQ